MPLTVEEIVQKNTPLSYERKYKGEGGKRVDMQEE